MGIFNNNHYQVIVDALNEATNTMPSEEFRKGVYWTIGTMVEMLEEDNPDFAIKDFEVTK